MAFGVIHEKRKDMQGGDIWACTACNSCLGLYGGQMLFSFRNTRNNTLQGEGAVVILEAIRRAGKNNISCVFALMVASFALNLGSMLAIAAETAPTSSELLEQGRQLLVAGKLAEAELVLDRAEKLAPSDSVILTLDARVKGRLGETSTA